MGLGDVYKRQVFNSAESYNNGGEDLTWNVDNVQFFTSLFERAISFNQPLASFKLNDTYFKFTNGSSDADMLESSNWNLIALDKMFYGASKFNQDMSHFALEKGKPSSAVDIFTLSGITSETLSTFLINTAKNKACLLYTSPSPRDLSTSRMPSSA